MANIFELLVERFKELQASQEFDKEALIEAHDKIYKGMREIESTQENNIMEITMRKPSEHWRPSVPLKGLRSIRARELQLDKHHNGRVLFGTLCADAHKMVSIMTVLEDEYGDAVRLAIYNISPSTMKREGPRKLYPKGSKVAVKQPYFKQGAQDGVLMVRVDNPQDVEILASSPRNAETSLAKDLLELRNKGNKCFRDEDWNKAIEFFSTCIDSALSRNKVEAQVPSASNIQEKVKEALLYSYSNRAEARIKLKEYGDAVQDCDKALALDQYHLKSLYRKGRAFHYLREYELAGQCFDRALEQIPTDNDIQLHYEKSMQLSRQNQRGEFDLSTYFINGCNAPELSNYIGPVLIKNSVGRARGLFVTDNVDIGDFLVVDNAIASCFTEITRLKGSPEIEVIINLGHLKRDLEAKVLSCAASSPRIMQQLEYLADSDEIRVPPMDLFRINNASWSNYHVRNQDWELDQQKLAKIMLNAGFHTQVIESNSEMNRQIEQFGLWALPSFINHSCYPNANCIVVGEAMVIIAARKIGAGEEITIPYINTFLPLFRRESAFMGYKCGCKRCMLEKSLVLVESSQLQEIVEFVDSIDVTMLSDLELWAIAMRVENIIDLLTTEEKHMIRESFFQFYPNILGLGRINPYARTILPSLRELVDGFQEVVPGDYACLHMFASLLVNAKSEDETDNVLLQKALEVCRGYMGKHEEGLLKAVLNSVARDVFKPGFTVFNFRKTNSCVGE